MADGDRVLVEHGIPALEGNFLQQLGRRASGIDLTGVMTGPESSEALKTLREKFRKAEPVDFVADISTATQVGRVLIERMNSRELAGKPLRFEYGFRLREFIEPSGLTTEEAPVTTPVDDDVTQQADEDTTQAVEEIDENVGELRIEVVFEDGPADFTNLSVLVEGTTHSGEEVFFAVDRQTNGIYVREGVPAGEYAVSIFRR